MEPKASFLVHSIITRANKLATLKESHDYESMKRSRTSPSERISAIDLLKVKLGQREDNDNLFTLSVHNQMKSSAELANVYGSEFNGLPNRTSTAANLIVKSTDVFRFVSYVLVLDI